MSNEPEKVELSSPDLAAEKRAAFEELFPGVIADGVLDVGRLSELLDIEPSVVPDGRERFGLMWAGKHDAVRTLLAPSRAALVPDLEQSIGFDTAENAFIEGDNLEVLKLLQKAYNDKVKLIYIDPPYNTGNDFVYNDDFGDGLRSYLEFTRQVDSEGNLVTASAEVLGRRHSGWLSMMYPRLTLARNLLRQDGVLAVSIDDHEMAPLRLLLDEIFGPEQFIATVVVKSRSSISNDKLVSPSHNYLVLYARNFSERFAKRADFGLDPVVDGFELSDERGAYKLVPVDGPGGAKKGNPYYEFQGVSGYWRYSRETMQAKFDNGLIVVRKGSLQQKYYLDDALGKRRTTNSWWDDGFETATATRRLKEFMGAAIFDNPKPVPLIRRLITLAANDDADVILDFFAGSGTTGHAVLEQNLHDGKRRRYLCVTLPEATNPRSEAREAGFLRVSDVTLARLSKAHADHAPAGLRVLKLAASGFRVPADDGEQLFDLSESTLRVPQDGVERIAAEVLLKEGVALGQPWERYTTGGADIVVADGVAVVTSLDITDEVVTDALELKPRVVVFLEDGFAGSDAVKANAFTNAKNLGITMKTV